MFTVHDEAGTDARFETVQSVFSHLQREQVDLGDALAVAMALHRPGITSVWFLHHGRNYAVSREGR